MDMEGQPCGNHVHRHPTASSGGSDIRRKPKKARRSTRACDFCHHRSIKCKGSIERASCCQNCVDFDVPCTYDRPIKKRGKKASVTGSSLARDAASPSLLLNIRHEHLHTHNADLQSSVETSSNLLSHSNQDDAHHVAWQTPTCGNLDAIHHTEADELVGFPLARETRQMALANRDKIANLINVYFEVVYPIFPFFHKPTLLRKIANREYLRSQDLFAAVMSVCALSSARARDGAVPLGKWDPVYFTQPTAEIFYAAAKNSIPSDLASSRSLNYMRSCALLALFGVQLGKVEIMHQYLGIYHALMAVDGLHDEKNWPDSIGIIEVEERRRLFWSLYTLEVYYSIVWGGIIRCRESQSRVAYPSEVDDEFLSEESSGSQPRQRSPASAHVLNVQDPVVNQCCWLHGWNFTTDMYRILEHAMDHLHRRRTQEIGPFSPSDLFPQDAPPQSVVLEKVMFMYAALPAIFKESRNAVGEMSEDIFGFQAANITATTQLVRMVLFTAEQSTTSQKCTIANELLDGLSKVPASFMRAISSPLLYHLAGIGSVLGSAMIENPLSEADYLQVRTALLGIADLLARLENTTSRNVGANSRLRNLITRIDRFMISQRRQKSPSYSLPSSVPGQSSTGLAVPSHSLPIGVNNVMHNSGENTGPLVSAQWNASHSSISYLQSIDDLYANATINNDVQLQFQIPPELLEDWPWPFDMAQGFGSFGMDQ